MNTIKKGRVSTFDKVFQKPKRFDLKINIKNAKKYSKIIKYQLVNTDNKIK